MVIWDNVSDWVMQIKLDQSILAIMFILHSLAWLVYDSWCIKSFTKNYFFPPKPSIFSDTLPMYYFDRHAANLTLHRINNV